MAVKGQDPSIVEELLIVDLSILNARDKGNTVVHMAIRKCRPQLLSVDVNAINNQKETAMDLAEKLQHGESAFEIKEALTEAGVKHARNVVVLFASIAFMAIFNFPGQYFQVGPDARSQHCR
ncbi:hypothetical protein C5167_039719 [Papaver somniferum]|uniref:PGG domain-containing protein n=1 Tax=Papaver somniferum TaxID=3469 RepID=A0A4Y7IH16_PAPSO|nr:hypothetical protein C5167_039719 [Papaver somniferum]